MSKIRVGIVGVGSCASALVQGVEFYSLNPDNFLGLTYPEIGGYHPKDIEFVVGFDVDKRKVGEYLQTAIFEKPNCNMEVIPDDHHFSCISQRAMVYRGPTFDGIAPHMRDLPEEVTFVESEQEPLTREDFKLQLLNHNVDILINYVPVGSIEAADFYLKAALETEVSVVNCMPSFISTEEAKELEQLAIDNDCTIVGSDMRSAFGASRLSEVLQGAMLDSGLTVTQHIQMNMAAGTTQGEESIINGRTANTDFLNMADKSRLHYKHISKENVLSGQSKVRNVEEKGMTLFAGPALTVLQRPGGTPMGSDNKIANIDIVAYGWAGARYELSGRLSVQDSPNSAGIVVDAIRFCKVAEEMGIRGYLRGPSAWTQKTPPVQMKTADAKFECDALARRELTNMTRKQVGEIDIENLEFTFQTAKTEYEK